MSVVMAFLGAILLLLQVLNALAKLVGRIRGLRKRGGASDKAPQR